MSAPLDAEALTRLPEGSVVLFGHESALRTRHRNWAVPSRNGIYTDTDLLSTASQRGDSITLVSLPVAALREAAGGDPEGLAERLEANLPEWDLIHREPIRAAVRVLRLIGGTE